jgi:hypothetical protein
LLVPRNKPLADYNRNRVADLRHAQGQQVVSFAAQSSLRVGIRKLHYLLQGQDDGWAEGLAGQTV